jgi:hypothetical protein
MFDGGSKGILGEVYSSDFGVVGQGIDDRLDSRSGGCCLSSRRHEEDGLDGLFKLSRSEGMVRGEGRMMMEGTNRWEGPKLNCRRRMRDMWAFNVARHTASLSAMHNPRVQPNYTLSPF